MGMWKNISATVAIMGILNGCAVLVGPEPDSRGKYVEVDDYYVDSYVYIPYEIRKLIADYTDGYSMPYVDRYGPEIYPEESPVNSYNLPSYIRADFNGDGYYDYAYMFSKLSWAETSWYNKSKLLVVASTHYGYELSSDYTLGTVTGYANIPVEEYWGIRLLRKGTHTVSIYNSGYIEETRVELDNDGIYLGSIEPEERSVFYVTGTKLNEFYLDMGAVAKKKILTAEEREKAGNNIGEITCIYIKCLSAHTSLGNLPRLALKIADMVI